ncbi:6-bladed beta-propeller [Gracilimonas sp.]|uniref:6-bladed beta-propeller n=1 Tax=Gracilimonas sp. TaxID=1974203 RepID=UPI00287150F8|nr:6-bladed beta-propeller [Gracilimonas sp.]
MMRKLSVALILLLTFLLFSCSSEEKTGSQNGFNYPKENSLEEVDAILDIDENQFLARPAFVVPMSDGSFVIADGQTLRLHHFDSSNTFIASYGGEGRGPGEFEGISDFILKNDTLKIVDGRSSRITSYVLEEGSLNRVSISDFEYVMLPDHPAAMLRSFVTNENDTYSAIYLYFGMMSQANPRPLELIIVPYSAAFKRDTTFSETSLTYSYEFTEDRYVINVPFYERGYYAELDGYVVHGLNNEPSIQLYGRSGEVEQVINLPDTRRILSAEEKESIHDERYKNAEDPNRFKSMVLSNMPDQRPVIRNIKADVDNRIWVKIFPEEDMTSDWLVFNLDGEAIARLSLPEGHAFQNAKGDRVFLQRETENGPEIVISEWN